MSYHAPTQTQVADVLTDAAEVYAEAAAMVPDTLTAIMLDEAAVYYRAAAGRLGIAGDPAAEITPVGGATRGPIATDAGHQVVFDTETRVQDALDQGIAALAGASERMDQLVALYDASIAWTDDLAEDARRAA